MLSQILKSRLDEMLLGDNSNYVLMQKFLNGNPWYRFISKN